MHVGEQCSKSAAPPEPATTDLPTDPATADAGNDAENDAEKAAGQAVGKDVGSATSGGTGEAGTRSRPPTGSAPTAVEPTAVEPTVADPTSAGTSELRMVLVSGRARSDGGFGELWLTDEALVRVRTGGNNSRILAGVVVAVPCAAAGGMVAGLLAALLAGGLAGAAVALVTALFGGRGASGATHEISQRDWDAYLGQFNPDDVLVVRLEQIAEARVRSGWNGGRLALSTSDHGRFRASWLQDTGGADALRAALPRQTFG